MLYFANPCGGDEVVQAMLAGDLGFIATPAQGNRRPDNVLWCADNGCFGRGYPGDAGWLDWLDWQARRDLELCAFATAPDVVGDAEATMTRSVPLLPEVRRRGFPAALVGQDGLEMLDVPWDAFDAFFIGGSTEWKLGEDAAQLAKEAKDRGKWLHMGRVNSRKRIRYAKSIGCDSVDGTLLTFGPSKHLAPLVRWMREVNG